MTTRLNALLQAASISLLLLLIPGTAAPQEQKQPENNAAASTQQPGTVANPGEAITGQPTAAPEQIQNQAPVQKEPSMPPQEELTEYRIKRGDTLWDIANTFFKDPFLWPFIWKANPSITNPDLIFAGNKLAIPNLTPIERAMQAPEATQAPIVEKQAPVAETPTEQKTTETAAIEQKPAEELAPAPVQRPVHPTEEEGPISKLILPEEQVRPIIDKYALLSAGFVNNLDSTDVIVGPIDDAKSIFGYGDSVYVKINGKDNVNIGDKYLIYSRLGTVLHPKTGVSYGRLFRCVGVLQITAKNPDSEVLAARITISFDDIRARNLLIPYQEPAPLYQPSGKKTKDISGYILEVTDRHSIVGQADFVYLDKGSADGVDPGDTFNVYAQPDKRSTLREKIGEVQVITVKERSSTAIVRKSINAFARGNPIDFKN